MISVSAETISAVGFYIGDICYVLDDDVYYGVWGRKVKDGDGWKDNGSPGFQEGPFVHDGLTVIVAHTAHGDGCYHDATDTMDFPVDSGCIGIVPLELVMDLEKAANLGRITPGNRAIMYTEDGEFHFYVYMDDPQHIRIDTKE